MFENKTSITPFAQTESPGDTNILLAILPFWNPLIPPMGISSLKSYLQPHGYHVKTIDANIEFQFREVYDDYFNSLQQYIPGHKKGNFYNIGNDVLQNHMMAHLNHEDEKGYVNLVKILVYQTFFYHIDDSQAEKLNKIIHELYIRLEEYVLKLLETEKPAVLGLSIYRATAAASLFAFKLAKANYPHIKTVMGGGIFSGELSLGSPNFDFFLKNTPYIDKIIVGEGEELFLQFLQNKLPQTQRVYTPKDLDNRVLALDTLNIPDFSDFDTRYYPVLAAYASRSCPFQCTFCAEKILWGKYRKKNARHIAEELVQASKKYNCQLFLMTDSLLNPVIKELSDAMAKIGDSIYWDGYLRADQAVCDPESTFQWRRGGFYRARLGLESGSQRILAAMKKNITPRQIKEAVTSLAHAGIKTTTYWLIGYPGETEDDFQQTLELIKELKNDIYEADCNPFSYFLTGQVESDVWREKNQSTLLYPESARDMLMIQTWIMEGEPSREETYQRINRFVNHCKKLGIPNPYTLQEIYQADERWKKLHKNAVPSLVEFMEAKNNQTRYIDENKKSKSWLVDRTPSSMMEHGENRTAVTMKETNYSKKIAFTISQNVKEKDYWLNQLSGKLVKTCFPRDLKKTAGNDDESPKKEAVRFRLEGDLFSRLIHLSNLSDFRLHIVMVTGIVALLHKYTGSRDILLGTPIYKQEARGELINTVLVLRNRVNNGMTFKELLLQVGQTILEANENQNYPIETLLYQLNLPVLADECPLFDAAVLLENIHDKSYLQPVNPGMVFSFLKTGEYIEGVVEYQPLLFDQTTIEIIISHFTVLLQQAITDINCSLPGINILSQKEKARLLMDFNHNNAAFSKDKTIFHFIEKYADTAPERIAILFEGTEVSYRSLNQRANRLARVLRERGIQADEPVGILLNRSPRMVECMLAVWKVGGVYIPMDSDYPTKRIIEILKNSRAKVLLTGTNYIKRELASACNREIIDPDQYANEIEKQDSSNPGIDIDMKDLAYIIYTSCSTGKPKGIMVEHIGMMNHIYAKINDLHLSRKSVVAQNASHTLDNSPWQFFAALTLGGKTVIYSNQLVQEPVRFVHRVIQDRVTSLEVVPSYLSGMLETLEPGKTPSLDYLLVTGEALKPDLVKRWFKKFPGIKMVNAYGPTEASDDITHYIMDKPPAADRIPIGKPVQNFNIYIVDEHMQLCPLRVKGEICVSGVGVGRGYLNNPELTNDKFLIVNDKLKTELAIEDTGSTDIYSSKPSPISPHSPYSTIYRTGDLGSWLPDGTIEFLGRKDYQVKIRGFRIELGEIKTQLETHSHVKEAVVVDREDEKGNKYLCAYLVTRGTLSVPDIKVHLSERLPQYMVPAHFMELEKMPLIPNGKIDRKALPEPVSEVTAAAPYVTYITEEMLKNVEIPREEKSDGKVLMEQEINQNQQHVLTEKVKHQILYTFNDTKVDYPKDKTLHQLFEAQVEKTPHSTALVYKDRCITYRELNRRANRLARFLQARGLEIEGIAGLLMDRSLEMIISLLGIMKAGGAYLPISPAYPKERLIFMLTDSGAELLLTTRGLVKETGFEKKTIFIDEKDAYPRDARNLENVNTSANLAYIIYTSGTTGKPKGVMIKHKNVNNLLCGLKNIIYKKYSNHLKVSIVAPFEFDASVQQIAGALLQGHCLYIVPEETRVDGAGLLEFYGKYNINISDGTPTHIRMLLENIEGRIYLPFIKHFIIAGEVLPREVTKNFLNRFQENIPKISNLYGPTETCVDSTFYHISKETIEMLHTIPIGKPLPNEQAYIVNKELKLQPIETAGELYIGGDGVARGYLNRPELTAEKFIKDITGAGDWKNKSFCGGPGGSFFKKSPLAAGGKRIYKTGDLARWLPDGNIEFLGRSDHQVKIRGLRIELGEIETLLKEYQGISEAVVVVKELNTGSTDNGDKYLCAYFVSSKAILEAELREHISSQLPPYLIPSSFARLEKMPLIHNGKLNRRLLEVLDVRTGSQIKKQGPTDEIERKMVKLWSNILGINEENIGIEDNFFQLGGHSLKVTVLVARVHKEFHVNIPLVKVFVAPTVKELSQYIRGAAETKHTSIKSVEKQEYYPLSSAQKRLYVIQQMEPNSIGYNMTGVHLLEGEIEKEKVENTFRQLIKRHESLRTSFVLLEGEPVQRVHGEVAFSIEYEEAAQEKVCGILETLVRAFDLSQVPLLRFGLIKIGESKHIVMLDMHHIISDGVSNHIFVNNLTALLEGKTLNPLRLQYKDFSQWQNRLIESGKLKQQEEYWLKIFPGELPVLSLPTDYMRPVVQSFEGSVVSFTIDTHEAAALKKLVLKEGCTLFMVLLSVFSILLAKLSGQADIVIGTPIGGRRHADLDNIIGMFVNTLALRTKPFKEKTFKTFLPEVKELVLQAYENQDYQFEELVKKVTVNRDASRNPVFDVVFSHQNIPMKKVVVSNLELKRYPYDTRITNFDLTLYSLELEKSVELTFGYCSKLFKNESIQRFIGYFKSIVTAVLRQPEKKISQLEILSEKEKHKLLYDFNDTKAIYPENKTILQLLEEQSDKNPGVSAVVEADVKPGATAGTKHITYSTLNEQSNRVARLLREKGIEADGIVGIMMDRSLEIIISLLGILKAGGAYLPISPACPKERLKFMLTDSGAELLLTTRGSAKETGFEKNTIFIDEKNVYPRDAHNPENVSTSVDLAYIIYTSGTTGKPKGVMMQHKSVNNLLCGLKNVIYQNYGNHLKVSIVAPFEFDASVQQIAGALLQGHCLYIVPEDTRVDGAGLLEFYRKYNINISDGTPTHFRLLLENIEGKIYLPFIKHFIIAGEVLPREVTMDFLSRFRGNIPKISNLYGPTETCVDSTFYHISKETIEMFHTIPIGKPLPNEQAYIVDKEIKLQPIGIAGELYIGGDGVARGYLNRPELTAEKFCLRRPGGRFLKKLPRETSAKNFLLKGSDKNHIQSCNHATKHLSPHHSPQYPITPSPHSPIYQTGDQARWLADGNIEFLGRIDHQVKIRGFRIELEEIETQLRRHECIKDAVVVAVEDEEGDKSICAYYIENARKPVELWPSVGEYSVWDELLYHAMTHDEARNISYKVAINRSVKDKTVVEIGTGPGVILARFCIEAGAQKVYAIEILEKSYKKAREIVKKLGLEEKIILIYGDAANVQLPEKVDVCLSQIIGNIASSEGAIHILNNAKGLLKKDGAMIPEKCETKIAAVQLPREIHETPGFSEIPQIYVDKIFKTYGYPFDFRICINNFPKSNIISNRETFENLNFSNIIAVENTQKVKFTISRNARLDGFLLWINLHTTEDEVIDTSKNKNVWSPVYIPVFYPGIEVSAGDTVQAECIRSLSNNNIYPDYKIKGVLIFKNGEKLEFQYDLPYLETGYQKIPFYKKLFNTDSIDVKENRHTGISAGELKEYLGRELPDYLIPSYFVKLEEIPLLPNGKVNKKALPVPEIEIEEEYAAPRNPVEEQLAAIWSEVLRLEKGVIGIDSNFFQLGGHSLKVTQLLTKIHKALDVKIPLREIFISPTIRGLSQHIKEAVEDKYASIEAVEKREYYPLSSAQKRLYILWQFETHRLTYNAPIMTLLVGELERERFKNTLERIITRHEILRTSFEMIDGSPAQKVYPFHELAFPVSYYKSKKESADPIINDFIKPFDLSRAPLLRVGLIEIEAGNHILMVDMHHIISDGSSMNLFVKDFIRLYQGNGSDLPPLRLQYKDYSHWHNREKRRKELANQEAYWSKVLAGEIPVLNLPVDYARPLMQSSEGNAMGFEIGPGKTQTLKKLALNEDVTIYMVLLAVFNILLSKISGQEDIVVGTPVEGRRYADLQPIIGMFVNTLAIRNYPERSQTFRAFLRELREHTLDAFENQEYQFEDLVDRLNVKRDPSRNPLFDVMFQLNTNDVPAVQIPGLKLQPYGNFHPFSKFDINLKAVELADRLFFSVEYCTKLFKVETIELFIENFNQIVSSILEDPEKKLSRIERISPEKKKTILAQLNQEYKIPTPPPLQEKLAESFQKHGNQSAIEYGSRTITYTSLHRRSDNIARWIINKGIKKQTLIGILLDNRMDLTAAVIGILKAGCVFVPLDTNYPEDRLEMMARHIDIRFIICDNINFTRLTVGNFTRYQAQYATEFIKIEGLLSPQAGDSPLVQYRPRDNIYVYFTSGSTGTPKAFIGKNQSLLNFIQWEIETFNINGDFRVSQLTTPGFDAFLRDVFVPLCTGGVICIPGNKDILLNPGALINWLDQSGVHLIHCIPSLFRLINSNTLTENHFKNLKFVLFSGERINPSDLVQWYETFAERIQMVNLWGTSETTLVKTFYFIHPSDIHRERIPVGKPMEGARVVILDKQMEVCDHLVTGEIYILTPFRTAGYCNAPELNNERFIRNPFNDNSHDFMHKTGDLGRFLSDGHIDLLGRNDRQVKIRGIRVELEEIESLLVRHGRVKEAVAVKREIAGGSELLWAYVVLRDSSEVEKQIVEESLVRELENHLAAKLPMYMVPANIMVMEKIPRTPRGKVDYRVLPDPLIQNRVDNIPPRDEIEKALGSMWSEILKFDPGKISITHRFFELGGNSLNAMALISKIHKAFNVKFPLPEVFIKVTIEQQAEFIRNAQVYRYAAIKSAEEKEYYALSSAQKRIYILQQMEPGSRTYNMPRTMVLEGEVDRERLEESFMKLIKRQESFRSSFEMLQGVPVQHIYRQVPFAMDYFEAEEEEVQQILNRYNRPFDLSRAPILRVGLIKTAEARQVLIVEMHHIISDGTSLALFVKDFMTLYRGEELPPLRIQYKDFSQWRNSKEETESVKNQEEYWLREFERDIPVLNLPTDYARPVIRKFDGSTIRFGIETEETEKLKALALKKEATLYMTLLAILNILLSRLSGQEDIVVGTGIEGRRHEDLRHTIGMFVNTLSLRNYPQGGKTYIEFLKEVKEKTLKAFENQDYPFEDLVEKVVINRDTSRNPLFDITFQVENIEMPTIEISKLKVRPYKYEDRLSKFDMTLRAFELKESLLFTVEFSMSLFKEKSIQRFMTYFRKILSSVVSTPGKRLSEIEMISGKEKEELLLQLNEALGKETKVIHHKQHNTIQDQLNTALHLFKDHISIAYGDSHLTYSELDKRSDYIANRMINKGIKDQTYVGLSVHNRMAFIISMIGILKAKSVFIPLDPDQPESRLEMMIGSLNLKYIMTENANVSQMWKPGFIEEHQLELILLEEGFGSGEDLEQKQSENSHWDADTNGPGIQYGSEDQIYIYFTSGTTGTPRAMVGKNLSLYHFIDWEIATFGIKQGYRVSQLTTPGFDAFLRDMFVPLCSGGTTCIPAGKEILMDAETLINWIEKFRVELIHCVPSVFRLLASCTDTLTTNHFKELKYVLLSGESIHPSHLVQWYETFDERIQLVNLWGISETTLIKTCYFIRKSDIHRERIPIGQPITGARAVILNNGMNLCGEFLKGEIYIITPFGTLGYCNDPDLTRDRFLPNPFTDNPELRMHKTGDLGRFLPDGNIDLLGRDDRQVKIRGIRLELEEIESILIRHPLVKEAVVIKKELPNDNELLWAYITGIESLSMAEESFPGTIKEYLQARLPGFMVPTEITRIEKIPRNPNGKIDYKKLPHLSHDGRERLIPPRNQVEEKILELWSETLKIETQTIGVTANFFRLGGNSLNIMSLISKIHKEFEVQIPYGQIFNHATIEAQARIIDGANQKKFVPISIAKEKEHYPLSSAQTRMFASQQMEKESTTYNVSTIVIIKGPIEKEQLEKSFRKLIMRHESLRTSFEFIDGKPMQKIHPQVEFTIEYSEAEGIGELTVDDRINRFIKPFDLSQAPMIRVGLTKTKEQEHILMVDLHHIIIDNTSLNLLIGEFLALYDGEELPQLTIQYKDFSEWQNSEKQKDILKKQEAYWMKIFEKEVPELNLPLDYERTKIQNSKSRRITFLVENDVIEKVKKLIAEEEVTMYIMLLSIFYILLSKLSKSTDIVIGTAVEGRSHMDLQQVIGMFVNTLALRNYPEREETFIEFLQEVKKRTLEAMDNQDYQYEDLVKKLRLQRPFGKDSLFDALFDLHTMQIKRNNNNGLKFLPYRLEVGQYPFDLILKATEVNGSIDISLIYSTALFKRSTAEKYTKRYTEILKQVVDNKTIRLGDIRISHDLSVSKSFSFKEDGSDFGF